MISVTNDFKTTVKGNYKQMYARISDGTETATGADNLKSVKIISEGGLCRTILRQAEVRVWGTYDWLDKDVSIEIGIKVGATPEYIDYGTFKVVSVTEDKANGERILKLYDPMYESLKAYEGQTYPLTVLQLLQAICTELGWTLATTTFTHSALSIASEVFLNQNLRYRDVLEDIAEATGTIIYFAGNDQLTLRAVDTDTSLETLTTNDVFKLTVDSKWGELNSLALARDPQNDVIVDQDAASIAANGLWELRIANNLILDGDRETYVTTLFTALNGVEYYQFESETIGLGYFEVGDTITVTDLASNTYKVLITSISLDLSSGFKEVIKGVAPDKSTTNYNTAGIIGQRITNTEIIVNKQEGEITLLAQDVANALIVPQQAEPPATPEVGDMYLDTDDNVIYRWTGSEWLATGLTTDDLGDYYTKDETDSQISITAEGINASVSATQTTANSAQALADANSLDIVDIKSGVTSLEVRADGLDIAVQGIGGTNLLRNSSGLKDSIEEWQEFLDGVLIDSDNDGTITQNTDTEENTESGGGIRIDEQFIVQTIPTIVNGDYTFYCRFKKLYDLDLTITGVSEVIPITAGEYVDETWAVFKYSFIATDTTTTIKIDNTASGIGSYGILADMVCKLGDVNGWVQAPNEVYGKNFRFDEDGFSVTSLTDDFKATLDNTKLGIYDTSGGSDRTVALFSKDAGLITGLTAQDEFTLQRYENSTKAARFIPTATGCMITVND